MIRMIKEIYWLLCDLPPSILTAVMALVGCLAIVIFWLTGLALGWDMGSTQ